MNATSAHPKAAFLILSVALTASAAGPTLPSAMDICVAVTYAFAGDDVLFLQGNLRDSQDTLNPLVYADYLRERGDKVSLAKAEAISYAVEVGSTPTADQQTKLDVLRTAAGWQEPIALGKFSGRLIFRNGIPIAIEFLGPKPEHGEATPRFFLTSEQLLGLLAQYPEISSITHLAARLAEEPFRSLVTPTLENELNRHPIALYTAVLRGAPGPVAHVRQRKQHPKEFLDFANRTALIDLLNSMPPEEITDRGLEALTTVILSYDRGSESNHFWGGGGKHPTASLGRLFADEASVDDIIAVVRNPNAHETLFRHAVASLESGLRGNEKQAASFLADINQEGTDPTPMVRVLDGLIEKTTSDTVRAAAVATRAECHRRIQEAEEKRKKGDKAPFGLGPLPSFKLKLRPPLPGG